MPRNTKNKNGPRQAQRPRIKSRRSAKPSEKRQRVAGDNSPKKPQEKRSYDKPHFIEVDSEHDGQRIDNFLVTRLKGVPKTHIYKIIRKGEVRVNKGRVKQTSRIKLGDSVRIPPIRLSENSADNIDTSKFAFLNHLTLFEDDALMVINKPSGMAVHAGSGIKVGIIEALRGLRSDLRYLELVHRLDRETSGCLVLAKKSSVLRALNEDFRSNSLKNKRVEKRYLALVEGNWKHGLRRVTKPLNTNARRHGERHVVVDNDGSYASSVVTPVDTCDLASLVEVKLLTGRTHQARVHLQSEGHAILGDVRYGNTETNKVAKRHKLKRLFLHASQLQFTHPVSEEKMTVLAELPDELKIVLEEYGLCTS